MTAIEVQIAAQEPAIMKSEDGELMKENVSNGSQNTMEKKMEGKIGGTEEKEAPSGANSSPDSQSEEDDDTFVCENDSECDSSQENGDRDGSPANKRKGNGSNAPKRKSPRLAKKVTSYAESRSDDDLDESD